VFVCHVQRNGIAGELERSGSTEKGHVVKIYDVERAIPENGREAAAIEHW
jgi:hypothetical protein